jgi:hypothetical protein
MDNQQSTKRNTTIGKDNNQDAVRRPQQRRQHGVMVTASASATVDGSHPAAGMHQVAGGDGNGGE